MKGIALIVHLFASSDSAQGAGAFQPAATNVSGAEFPRVDSSSKARFRVSASDGATVRLKFWGGPKLDVEKHADGYVRRADIVKSHALLLDANFKQVSYQSPGTSDELQTWHRDLDDFGPQLFQEASSRP